jgi:hypothetical protein
LLFNTNLLKECDWDMQEFFRRHEGTTAGFGSEFRPTEQLQRVVGEHPNFKFLERKLEVGFKYFLKQDLEEDERKREYSAQWERGNHQSAQLAEEEVKELLEGDVKHGFALPAASGRSVPTTRGHDVSMSLKADGTRKLKSRFTHDLSFSTTAADA